MDESTLCLEIWQYKEYRFPNEKFLNAQPIPKSRVYPEIVYESKQFAIIQLFNTIYLQQ